MNSLRSPLIFIKRIVLFMMSPKWGSHQNQFLLFELSVQKAFHISPLECPNCHARMEYVIEIT